MTRKKKKLLTSKEAALLLRVSPEMVSYLRLNENLPFHKKNKYILFSEPEVLRWRNKRLAENTTVVMNLKEYYNQIKLYRFIDYEQFKDKVSAIAFLEEDNVIKYINRQHLDKEIVNLVGDIIYAYWDSFTPRCSACGNKIHGHLATDLCSNCKSALLRKKPQEDT